MINGRTHDEIKKGLECCRRGVSQCLDCPYNDECHLPFGSDPETDGLALIQQLESELEPLRKAKEENRLIILPYVPGTPVYVVDGYEVVQMEYHPSMYGRRCHTSKEELYKEFYK